MSSIPVRKGTVIGTRRNAASKLASGSSPPENNKNNKTSQSSKLQKEPPPRPLTRQSSKKELYDENTKLKAEIKAHEDRLKEMQHAIYAEKERFGKLEKDSTSKENCLKENVGDITKKSEKLETKLHDYEKKLLLCNIDPVSLERLDPDVQNEELIQERCEKAKGRVTNLKERLKDFNQEALKCIENLQTMDENLDRIDCEMVVVDQPIGPLTSVDPVEH